MTRGFPFNLPPRNLQPSSIKGGRSTNVTNALKANAETPLFNSIASMATASPSTIVRNVLIARLYTSHN